MTLPADALEALRESDQRVARLVEVLDPSGRVLRTLAVDGGGVEVDASAGVRRRCSLSLYDPDGDLTPATARDLLTPFGTELRLWRGVDLVAGTALLVELDSQVEWDAGTHHNTEAPEGVLQLT